MLLLLSLVLFTLRVTSEMFDPMDDGNLFGAGAMGNIGKPDCQTQCGNFTIPYPFGIGEGCFFEESLELTCNSTHYDPPKLFLGKDQNIKIYSISESEMRIYNTVAYRCHDDSGYETNDFSGLIQLGKSSFTFSQKNKFTVVGCDDFALISGVDGVDLSSGCMGLCHKAKDVTSGKCAGHGCCQTSIPVGLRSYKARFFSFHNHTKVHFFNHCGFAFLGEEDSFQFGGAPDLSDPSDFYKRTKSTVPVVLDWVVGRGTRSCSQAPTECKGNSTCIDDAVSGGYRCSCNKGYKGNPYLDPGCQAKPEGCLTRCGNLTVQYPFGIGKGCSLDESFELTCNSTHYDPPKLFIGLTNIEIYNVSESEMRIFNSGAYQCYNEYGHVTNNVADKMIDLTTTPFAFSQKNTFNVIGCDDIAVLTGNEGDFIIGCSGSCIVSNDTLTGIRNCSRVQGCCQTSIPKGLKYYNARLFSTSNHKEVHRFNPCGFAFLGEEDGYQFGGVPVSSDAAYLYQRNISMVPIVVDWVVGGKQSCSQATECKGNSNCIDDADTGGYRCRCHVGYKGNPYLPPGCEDINECQDNITYPCYGHCINTQGSYNCSCLQGYTGNATLVDGCLPNHPKDSTAASPSASPAAEDSRFRALEISLALVFGLLIIFSGITGIYFGIRKRNLIKLREKFFEQNGGVFLKQKLKAPGATDAVTMFSTEQLRKATDNYSKERIVGQGGYGVVYKGFLPDKRVVAIKRSRLVDGTQAEQFINEIWILTQVIHRNVVKLLGCCLEEEVPVLVYEFISNNTLFYHIHNRSGGMSWLSWENRLRVAAEAAGALAYLHSQTSMPIIHRDVKSANILLDENYTTKISDFGGSRLVPIDHDQVTTLVQGTLGYLDPEYFHTSLLTDKSDVYSFGMVLAELITGKKPICADRANQEKSLATYFVKSMKENRLFQIVEPRLLREGTLDQLQTVAELVKRCHSLLGEDRPTMRDVAMELEGLRKFTTHPWVPLQTPEESRSLTLEVEESDLYGVPLIPYSSSEWESYSGITESAFQENKPR